MITLEIDVGQGYDYVEGANNSIHNTMNNLSRNKPVALVVGAAGFIGSFLVERLLEKGIQVIGVDDFTSSKRENLHEASKDKDFQLISQSLTDIPDFQLPRLDYAVFVITEDLASDRYLETFSKFLKICVDYKPKIVLCSTIALYDSKQDDNLKIAEKRLADVALASKINARVVRLSAVFGPRMNFRDNDPVVRLIKSAVQNRLNQEQTPLEFTTRALFIKDAVDLLIKTIMHGFTSQKIYDGASIEPVKVSEIKQVLMDPVWYEEKGFKPTELPPWPSPNLNKTIKELSWKPKTNIIIALKETLAYFNNHPEAVPKEVIEVKKPSAPWQFSKLEEKEESEVKKEQTGKQETKKRSLRVNTRSIRHESITIIGLIIIFFAVIFPILKVGFSVFELKIHLQNSINQTSQGNFIEALNESNRAEADIKYLTNTFNNFSLLKKVDAVKTPYEAIEQSLGLARRAVSANLHTVSGVKNLAGAFAVISGEKTGDSVILINDAKTEFATADSELGEVSASLMDKSFTNKIPQFMQQELGLIEGKINSYHQTINLGRTSAELLPQIIALDTEKSYLVVLQDNRILRPGGGVIRSYVQVTFDHGKLKEIKGDMVENLDRTYEARIDPPVELKNDLGESNWRLKDASFDPDFPTSARNIAWFYNKESGTQVSGVIALDLVSVSKLLEAVGPLKLANSNEVSSSNLSQKIAITRDGNQVSADVLKTLVERIFYLSKQNWVVLAKNSEESLAQKHLLLYLSDQNAFSYLVSNGWAGSMPVQKKEKTGERNEFLSFSEINMTQGQDSTTVERAINIESKIDANGQVSHKLSVDYSATEKLTGPYKARLKVYLAGGTKMLKSTWGGKMIKDISPFSDFGKSGYSMLLELGVGEQKQLVLEYQDLTVVKFDNNQLKYQLSLVKQPDQASIPLNFKLVFPADLKAETNLKTGAGEVTSSDQLSQDKTLEVIFRK